MRLVEARPFMARFATFVDRRSAFVVGGLVAANALIVLLTALYSIRHNGWQFYDGGDGTEYWEEGWQLSSLHISGAAISFGAPLLMAPIAWFSGPSLLAALPAIVILYAGVFGALGVFFFYKLASALAGRRFGVWATALWVLIPALAPQFFDSRYRPRFIVNVLPHWRGLNALADFPGMTVCIAAAWLVVRVMNRRSPADAVAAGALTGFIVAIKPSDGLFVAAALFGLLVARCWRELPCFVGGLAPALVALTVWKWKGLGRVPLFALGTTHEAAGPTLVGAPSTDWVHRYLPIDIHQFQHNLDGIREYGWDLRLLEYLVLAGAAAAILRLGARGAFIVAWFAAYVGIKGSVALATVPDTSFWRYTEHALPALVLLVASVQLLVPRGRGRRLLAGVSEPAIRMRTALITVVLLGILPLGVVVAARAANGSSVHFLNENIAATTQDLHLRVRRSGRRLEASWDPPANSGTSVAYRVYESPQPCSSYGVPVPSCIIVFPPTRIIVFPPTTLTTERHVVVPYVPGSRWLRIAVGADYLFNPAKAETFLVTPAVAIPR